MDAIGGSAGPVEWQISNLHDDIVGTTTSGTSFDLTSVANEFGNMNDSAEVGTDRYGWLGGKQRAADNPDGVVLMGLRLYNPETGRFFSVDPVAGGSCNRYDYTCQNPTNATDLDGKCFGLDCFHWRRAWDRGWPKIRHGFARIGSTIAHIHWVPQRWCRRGSYCRACIAPGAGGYIGGLAGSFRWSIFGFIGSCAAGMLYKLWS